MCIHVRCINTSVCNKQKMTIQTWKYLMRIRLVATTRTNAGTTNSPQYWTGGKWEFLRRIYCWMITVLIDDLFNMVFVITAVLSFTQKYLKNAEEGDGSTCFGSASADQLICDCWQSLSLHYPYFLWTLLHLTDEFVSVNDIPNIQVKVSCFEELSLTWVKMSHSRLDQLILLDYSSIMA